MHRNGFGLEADQAAQVVLVPGTRQPFVGNAHLERPVLPQQVMGNVLGMVMWWAVWPVHAAWSSPKVTSRTQWWACDA